MILLMLSFTFTRISIYYCSPDVTTTIHSNCFTMWGQKRAQVNHEILFPYLKWLQAAQTPTTLSFHERLMLYNIHVMRMTVGGCGLGDWAGHSLLAGWWFDQLFPFTCQCPWASSVPDGCVRENKNQFVKCFVPFQCSPFTIYYEGINWPYVVAAGVCASSKSHRAVAVEELLEKRTAGEPHPAASIYTPVCI